VNEQCCVGYRLCFGTRGIVLCDSCDVEIPPDAAGVFTMRGTDSRGVCGKKGYTFSSSCDLSHILRFVG